MKNVLIPILFLLFLSIGTTSEAQIPGYGNCTMDMSVSSSACINNGATRRIVFGVNSGQNNVEIYSNGALVAQGNSPSKVFYFPTRSYPYHVYIECRSLCRRDGCIVVIEPC